MAEIVKAATVDTVWASTTYNKNSYNWMDVLETSSPSDFSFGIARGENYATYNRACIQFTTPEHIALSEFIEFRFKSAGDTEEFVAQYHLYDSNYDVVTTGETDAYTISFNENGTITIPCAEIKSNTTYYLLLECTRSPYELEVGTGHGTYVRTSSVEIVVVCNGGIVYIGNGSELEMYSCYIDNGESWEQFIPCIDDGESWDQC